MLSVVLLPVNLPAQRILFRIDLGSLPGTESATVNTVTNDLSVQRRLASLERRCLTRRQLATADSLRNPVLLIHLAARNVLTRQHAAQCQRRGDCKDNLFHCIPCSLAIQTRKVRKGCAGCTMNVSSCKTRTNGFERRWRHS